MGFGGGVTAMRRRYSIHALSALFCWALGLFATARISPVRGEDADIFQFFEKEAEAMQVVTVSRLPLSVRQAPATVYVVTAEEIRASGARTLWDALRGVPGVNVMATQTFYGEVSIRGLDKVLSNRTLVLLDGKTVLNGLFDTAYWEGIPVPLAEVDLIEVVEGPASACRWCSRSGETPN